MSQCARIPLMRCREIVGYALVDPGDYNDLWLGRWWYLDRNGYARHNRTVDGSKRAILMHREVLGLAHGDGLEVDHINRNKLDNRRCNLRLASRALQAQNRSACRGAASPFRAVYLEPRNVYLKWRARPSVNGRYVSLGCYTTELEAAMAVERFRQEHMPYVTPDPLLRRAA